MLGPLELDRIAFIGRTFGEYLDMFGFSPEDLAGRTVLDCPAGPSSFTAEARARGIMATASDLLYGSGPRELAGLGRDDIEHILLRLDEGYGIYKWEYYTNKERLRALRQKALNLFAADFEEGKRQGRYVPATLPHLPFRDREFDIVLSSHFLFLYSETLEPGFHLACLGELLRVSSGEVRVFPVTSGDGEPYPHLDWLVSALEGKGVRAGLEEVQLEFLMGANKMLRLFRNNQ